MTPAYRLRPIAPADGPALAALVARSPDAGRVSVSPRYHAPLVDVTLTMHPDSVGVVAELPDSQVLIGAAWVSFGGCRLAGDSASYALMNSLVVDPDHRRQGVAGALTGWRLERVAEREGEIVVMAAIQRGNAGSTANTASWATQVTGPVRITPVPMRKRPPRPWNGQQVVIREVRPHEVEQVTDGINAFYADFSLSKPQDAESLADWLNRSPLDSPVNHYVVAVDGSGRLLAGVGIQETPRLVTLEVTRMPRLVRIANLVAKVVPPDHVMRSLQTSLHWFAPGQLDVGRHLWQTLRWSWRDRGNGLLATVDPRSPVRQLIHNPPWLPTTSLSLALRSTSQLDPTQPMDPPG